MPISDGTFESVFQAYLDNAGYDSPPDTSKCRAFITACRQLLAFPARASQNSVDTEFDKVSIREESKRAEQWLAQHPDTTTTRSSSAVIRFDLGDRA